MIASDRTSWGRHLRARHEVAELRWRHEPLPPAAHGGKTLLPYGNGRSYGDVCLNDGGVLLDCRSLDRFIAFDHGSGRLRCEAGVLLSEIHELCVPRGWFLPVTPGTQQVTVGGAIANDVHGKNHHRAGTFGAHVRCLELLRSDGTRRLCVGGARDEWFDATVGGLGLTGVVTWAEIQLKSVSSAHVDHQVIRFPELGDYFRLAEESDQAFEYTVAWIDTFTRGRHLGRGLFSRANHAGQGGGPPAARASLRIPFLLPFGAVSPLGMKIGNALYYHRPRRNVSQTRCHYARYLYPLDAVANWNRVYGPRGFLQHQCVIPAPDAEATVREMLERVARAGAGASLAVLKTFGEAPAPGLLSFARPGVTLAMDFPARGRETLSLLQELDRVTMAAGGAVNPSKDARMSAACFQASFPGWRAFARFIDPQFSSSFWRRVSRETA